MTREEQAQYISEKLMEDPEFKKAFVGAITDAVNEVVKVIKALQQEPCADAISRQAAIDACLNGWNKDYKEIVEEIRALPPVKPQYTDAEIQKMQDLEFAEIQKAYEIGKAENPNKWIPVSERLPEDNKTYLVTVELTFARGERYVSQERKDNWDKLKECGHEIIAWMPLPEPYKASPTGSESEEKK